MHFVTVEEAAKIIGLSKSQIWRLQQNGKLKKHLVNGVQMVAMLDAINYNLEIEQERIERLDAFDKLLTVLDNKYPTRLAIACVLKVTDRSLRNYVKGIRVPDDKLLKRMLHVSR